MTSPPNRKKLSIYPYNGKEFVLLDSRQIIPPPGAIPFLLKNLHSAHVGNERTVRLTKQLFFWHGMLNDGNHRLFSLTMANSAFAGAFSYGLQILQLFLESQIVPHLFRHQEQFTLLLPPNQPYADLIDFKTGYTCMTTSLPIHSSENILW